MCTLKNDLMSAFSWYCLFGTCEFKINVDSCFCLVHCEIPVLLDNICNGAAVNWPAGLGLL